MVGLPLAGAIGVLGVGLGSLAEAAALPRRQGVLPGSGTSTSWQSFIRTPSRPRITPQRVIGGSVVGNVTNPTGFITGNGPTVLSRGTSDPNPPCLTVDFGQNYAGLLGIDFGGSVQDSSSTAFQRPGLTLAFSETMQFLTSTSDFTRSQNAGANALVFDGVDHVSVNSTSYTWTDTLGCEYGKQVCADGLHGFRYLKVCLAAYAGDSTYTSGYGEVAIDGIYLDYQGFFGSPDTYTGWFQCSDADLTQWWYDGVYTNDLATDIFLANDTEPRNAASPSLIGKLVLHDGAKRDRDPYVGDISVSGLTSFLSHDLAERVTNVIGDLADHQRSDGWIPPASINDYTLALFDYPLHWVKCTYDLVMYTGASDFLNQYYPALVKTLDTFYPSMTNSATNLLNKPSSYGDYAFLPRSGQITYYNALYVLVLNQAAELADSLSKSDDAARWRARASTVAAALLATNWDASVGAFFDGGPCGSAAMCDTHAQDGNSISILAGVTNTSTSESALGYLATHMAQPYGNAFYDNGVLDGSFNSRVYAFLSYFEIAARFETSPDTLESAFDEIRRLYGWMATNDPGVTQWEGIGGGGQPYEGGFTSMAHGWSTGIVPLMSNYVLGVTPTGPGFSSWVVKPVMSAGGLTWAQGVVPTPEGPITVAWERTANVYALKVSAPAGTRGIVSLALGEASADSVTVDGRGVGTSADVEAGYVQLAHDGGTHAYTIAVAQ